MAEGVIDGGRKMQLRGGRRGDMSDEQVETFFVTLAQTCNVVRSARAAGFSANWAYRRRKTDGAFRNGWVAAVREGYAKLELMLLERAMKGTPKLVRTAAGGDRVMRAYSTPLAVALLRRHAATADEAGYEHDDDELREVRERIMEKLERMREREMGVSFTLTSNQIAASDVVVASIASGASAASYAVEVDAVAAGSCRVQLRNVSAGSLAEAVVLNFAVVKAVAA